MTRLRWYVVRRERTRCSGIRRRRSIQGSSSGCDAVVHLAGKNIAGLWTKKFKQEVLESRVSGARTLATAAAASYRLSGMPQVFVSASGMSYYGDRGDELLTEESSAGRGFLAEVVKQWEAATAPASEAGVRVVNLRIGMVLARDGGALKPMLTPFRLGLGGRVGSGKQYWSWIALDDVIGAMMFALKHDSLRGPVNIVGPAPVPQPGVRTRSRPGVTSPRDISFAGARGAGIARRDGTGVALDLGTGAAGKAERGRIPLSLYGTGGCVARRTRVTCQ